MPRTKGRAHPQARRDTAAGASDMLLGAVNDGLRPVDDPEIGRHGEERRIGLGAHDILQLKGLHAHARIAAFAIDDGFQIGRRPNLRDDADGRVSLPI